MTTEQQLLRQKRDSVVTKHVDAENRHDIDAAIATFHTPRYEVMPMGIVHDGEQAVGELLSGMFKGFPDFTVEIIKTHHSDEAVILEIRLKGTHRGDWAGQFYARSLRDGGRGHAGTNRQTRCGAGKGLLLSLGPFQLCQAGRARTGYGRRDGLCWASCRLGTGDASRLHRQPLP